MSAVGPSHDVTAPPLLSEETEERRRWRQSDRRESDMSGLLLLLLLALHPQRPPGAPTPNQETLGTPPGRGSSEWPLVPGAEGLGSSPADIAPTQDSRFLLGLKGLIQANLSSENPNIQVTIEVDPSSQAEVELDLSDTRTDWGDPQWRTHHALFWPLFWEYNDFSDADVSTMDDVQNTGETSQYEWEENVLSGGDYDGHGAPDENWVTDKYLYDYEEDWSPWSPCSASCGRPSQRRTRSCGYSCTATESRVCDLPPCPGEDDAEDSTFLGTQEAQSIAPTRQSAPQDSCERWLSCRSEFLSNYLQRVLTELPSCPCVFPSEAVYSSLVLRDERLSSTFRWHDASGLRERLDIYNPGARFCLRSLLSRDSSSLGAQHCCYDHSLRLITRGRAAGIPNLISAEFSPELHYKADVLPWILCKGDWSRIHPLRPPNNGNGCPENPAEEEEYLAQQQDAQEF
ncbi:isthmin-2-like [Hyla sarda]|uniref:isthmin-2-like n=1 Tax=Hyla sarda TaxID=327740 RepID=UPI0024C38074|nr:isthmin-2-like [Hyla sarda]